MARLNEILVGRFNRAYQKLTGIKGSPPVPTLAPEIMPSHVVFSGAEERYLQGWNRFANTINFGASAANINVLRLRNPSTSNMVAVFEKFLLSNTGIAATNVILSNGPTAADLASALVMTNSRLDPRGNPTPVIIGTQTQVASQSSLGNAWTTLPLLVNVNWDYISTDLQEVPLLPGDAIQIQTSLVNNASCFGFMWRERFLEEPERT